MKTSTKRTVTRPVVGSRSSAAWLEVVPEGRPIREGSPRQLASLIESWLEDTSDHDEKFWPVLEQDLASTTRG